MILAIDSASDWASLALLNPSQATLLAEETWASRNRHTVELMPRLVRMMDGTGVKPEQLSALAVSIGPGSYTGLRIGLSVAKGINLAHGTPLVTVPTLDATALPHVGQGHWLCALVQAGRGRVCWALYAPTSKPDDIQLAGDYRLGSLAEVAEACTAHDETWFCGEVGLGNQQELRQRLGEKARFLSPAQSLRRAGFVAQLGWVRWQQGQFSDPALAAPIYLPRSVGGASA